MLYIDYVKKTHKIIWLWREDLKRINLLFHVMWPKLNCIMVGVIQVNKNIQFWHVTIESKYEIFL
jgi:hypothetical protein